MHDLSHRESIPFLIILKTMSTMMSSWHGTDYRITSLLWGEPPVTGGFSSKGVVIWSFEVCLMSVWTNCWIRSPVAVVWALLWRHNGRDGVSNHQPHDCLLNRLFRVQIKENIKAPRHWLSCGELTDDRLTPENVPIWWRHHGHISSEIWTVIIAACHI